MKNFLNVLAGVCGLGLLVASCNEGLKRQEVVQCYEAQKICVDFWDVHGGDCLECKEAKRCEAEGLI